MNVMDKIDPNGMDSANSECEKECVKVLEKRGEKRSSMKRAKQNVTPERYLIASGGAKKTRAARGLSYSVAPLFPNPPNRLANRVPH